MSDLGPIGRLGRWAATHFRVGLVALGVLIAVGLGVLAPRVEHALSGAGWQANGSESVEARELIDAELRRPRQLRAPGRRPLATTRPSRDPAFDAGDRAAPARRSRATTP